MDTVGMKRANGRIEVRRNANGRIGVRRNANE